MSASRRRAVAAILLAGVLAVVLPGCRSGGRSGSTYQSGSESMAPTLRLDDVVAGTQNTGDLRRGDIIVLVAPAPAGSAKGPTVIRRVIGLPGETVQGKDGAIVVNGHPLDESGYLAPGMRSKGFPSETLAPGTLWVLADARQESRDSVTFGSLPNDAVRLRVTRIKAPKDRRGPIPRVTYPG